MTDMAAPARSGDRLIFLLMENVAIDILPLEDYTKLDIIPT